MDSCTKGFAPKFLDGCSGVPFNLDGSIPRKFAVERFIPDCQGDFQRMVGVAQGLEHLTVAQRVVGSNPIIHP